MSYLRGSSTQVRPITQQIYDLIRRNNQIHKQVTDYLQDLSHIELANNAHATS
jgi:hypothetical protein